MFEWIVEAWQSWFTPLPSVLAGVVELEMGRYPFAVEAVRLTKVRADAELALSIPEHVPDWSAQLPSVFRLGTFRGLYVGNGTVTNADVEAAPSHGIRELKIGWVHAAHSFSGAPAERLVLEAGAPSSTRCRDLNDLVAYHTGFDDALGAVCSLPHLTVLILVDTRVTADGLAGAGRAGIGEPVYSENRVKPPHAASYGEWPDLVRLTLNKVGVIDDQLEAITALKSLQILELPNNDIFRRPSAASPDSPNSCHSISHGQGSTTRSSSR